MTRDKYLYELINRCILIACLDNIIVENFELSDDRKFYIEIEKQFLTCLKFYREMYELCEQGKMSEAEIDAELNTALNLIRQNAIKRLLKDFEIYLNETSILEEKKKNAMETLKKELQLNDINSEYFLKKIREFRAME